MSHHGTWGGIWLATWSTRSMVKRWVVCHFIPILLRSICLISSHQSEMCRFRGLVLDKKPMCLGCQTNNASSSSQLVYQSVSIWAKEEINCGFVQGTHIYPHIHDFISRQLCLINKACLEVLDFLKKKRTFVCVCVCPPDLPLNQKHQLIHW